MTQGERAGLCICPHCRKTVEVGKSNVVPRMISIREAAILLGVKPRRIYQLMHTDESFGRCVLKFGERQMRIHEERFMAWLNDPAREAA